MGNREFLGDRRVVIRAEKVASDFGSSSRAFDLKLSRDSYWYTIRIGEEFASFLVFSVLIGHTAKPLWIAEDHHGGMLGSAQILSRWERD